MSAEAVCEVSLRTAAVQVGVNPAQRPTARKGVRTNHWSSQVSSTFDRWFSVYAKP
jgi:hypothetical protein